LGSVLDFMPGIVWDVDAFAGQNFYNFPFDLKGRFARQNIKNLLAFRVIMHDFRSSGGHFL